MATSIASQLQALKSFVKADGAEPVKRPFTRPSILFDPKEAADIDIDTIFSISLSGLEFLISTDERFKTYQNDLFSHKSREVDRELLGIQENNQIDASISSYLRLLSGYLELSFAVKTLEYLIRRYKIHVYNAEDLILCALPYHDTHVFVKIVQLTPSGNNMWKFLDGVREKGAPPPRQVIVQQCIRDTGVLEALCNYATPIKKILPTRPVIGFCTAVIVDVLRSITTVDSDVVKRILPYVTSGLQPSAKREMDQKAGALIIISTLADKVALSPILVKSLMRSLADVARADGKEQADLQWVRMTIMTLINLVQSQSVDTIPKKTLYVLNDIRNISTVLGGLSKEFNVDRFLAIMLDSLTEYSPEDDGCLRILVSILENVSMKGFVDRIVFKIFMKISRNKHEAVASEAGSAAKQILIFLNRMYPVELRVAVHKVLEDTKLQSKKGQSSYEIVCQILDGNFEASHAVSDSKIWFALEHPKAEVRRNTLSGLDVKEILSLKATDSQRFDTIQEAILRRLNDGDLGVLKAVLSLERLPEIISSPLLLNALQDVLHRCVVILMQSTASDKSLACDVAVSCLQCAILSFQDQDEYAATLAKMAFSLILVVPKTRRLNLSALELAKKLKWPLFENLVSPLMVSKREENKEVKTKTERNTKEGAASQPIAKLSATGKKKDLEHVTSVNMENINGLATAFLKNHEEYMPWLVDCCNDLELSKTLFFLILLQSFMMPEKDVGQLSALIVDCIPVLKAEWEKLSSWYSLPLEKSDTEPLESCNSFLARVFDTNVRELNAEILVCLFRKLQEALILAAPENLLMDKNGVWVQTLQDLFAFFTSQPKNVFKEHIRYLVASCKTSISHFLLNLFTEEGLSVAVQVGSLASFAYLCSISEGTTTFERLAAFPAILVPLSSDNQDLRVAAMSCIEGLHTVWEGININRSRNGSSAVWIHSLGELLALLVQHKRMILSDRDILPSFFTSLLSSSHEGLLVRPTFGRLDKSTKDDILAFMLGFAIGHSAYAKLKIFSLLKGLGSVIMNITGVKPLFNELLERRRHQTLSKVEVGILCVLLECCMLTSPLETDLEDPVLTALQIDGLSTEDPSVTEPCLTVLGSLSNSFYDGFKPERQVLLFQMLVLLFRSDKADIQNATRDCLMRINIHCSTVCRMLGSVSNKEHPLTGLRMGKKKKKASHQSPEVCLDLNQMRDNNLLFVSSLLDVLLLKKSMQDRTLLVGPLLKLLQGSVLDGGWMHPATDQDSDSPTPVDAVVHIQQTVLLILEDIVASVLNDATKKVNISENFDLELLVTCARAASDSVTRNHVFSLLSTIAKVIPDKVLDHILDILVVIGESATSKWDSYSQRVFEDFMSAVVPCWLSKSDDMKKLLQIFVDILPQVSGRQRLSIVMPLLRNLGETVCLGSLLFLLFNSLSSKESLSCLAVDKPSLDSIASVVTTEWEYDFAAQLTGQYSCMIWLPSLALLLQETGTRSDMSMERLVTMQFISDKLQDPEIAFKLDSGEDSDSIQKTLGELMEKVVLHLQLVDLNKKQRALSSMVRKELTQRIHVVLKTTTKSLMPTTFFKVIIQLLGCTEKFVRKKALRLLCESVKELGTIDHRHERKGAVSSLRRSWIHLDELAHESYKQMFLEILKLIDNSMDGSGASLKLAAISTLEVLGNWFSSDHSLFGMCLASIGRNICSDDPSVSSSCLRTTGALINVLGPRALPELPSIMKSVLRKAHDVFASVTAESDGSEKISTSSSHSTDSVFMGVLITLEAVVDKLGGFLNPYLDDILGLLVLRPQYTSTCDIKLKSKADVIRKLITHKIPVRLLLPPLLKKYTDAIQYGDSSLSVTFEMLRHLVATMDRSSIGAYHRKFYDLCLLGLDLRGHHPSSVKNIDVVERSVIDAMVALTMKLTETMFRPLFISTIDWAAANVEDGDFISSKKIDRAISLYSLVNKLSESHRSLFVPYFKYLLDGCVRHLSLGEDANVGLTRKKKKAKLQESNSDNKDSNRSTSLENWHLRALILSSLRKCFLYDTGSLKLLDSSNFQVLLKPIVSQFAMDPPASLEQHPNVPSVEEVDDLLVACVGQMAVTAGSDLLWKPLNHEVLMQTLSEKIRTRILALRTVKYLVENLKEEYLVLLAETIPFLGELLEDVEPSVKSLAQEILKEMESMSGESLRQYL